MHKNEIIYSPNSIIASEILKTLFMFIYKNFN